MNHVAINGISLAYERAGRGHPLVLVHGFPLDHSSWASLVPHLTDTFDVIQPDLRGFGASSAPESGYSLEDMAADLDALLTALNLPSAFLAGHSMGGYVSLAFARRFGPRLRGLALIGSQAVADTPERQAGRHTTAAQVLEQGPLAVAGMAEKLSANPDQTSFLRELILRQKPVGLAHALKAMAARPDSQALLASLQVPLVLVHGLADSLIPFDRSREMKTLYPQANLTELPGVGHSPALEAPAETAAALQRLL